MSSQWKRTAAALARRCVAAREKGVGRGVRPQMFSGAFPFLQQTAGFCSSVKAIKPPSERPKMVILGSGWASVNLIRNLDRRTLEQYNIIVCSPANHFVNTPLLPSVTVGTVEPRSVAEPIRNLIRKHRMSYPDSFMKFNEAEAIDVDVEGKRVKVSTRNRSFGYEVQGMKSSVVESEYWLNYDVLVCAVGATTNTFGTPGALEHCAFLKTVQDAIKIRTTLLDCFETAAVYATPDGPSSDEEIDRLLTFVVIGAGPTGVEVAAEIRDFAKEDIIRGYSGFKDRNIKVQIVEMSDAMLGTYEQIIQDYARERFKKSDIEMFTKHQVKRVNEKSVEALCLETGETKILPFGMCVWASGVRPNNISLEIAKKIQGSRMLEVDSNLRVRGAEGSIFALGDCAKITYPTMKANAADLFQKADKNGDGVLSPAEFKDMIQQARMEYPQMEAYLSNARQEAFHDSGTAFITFEGFEKALEKVDKELKMLPPTAQVAAQQGEYLAKIINGFTQEELSHPEGFKPRFEYNHQGSMAYIGGEHAVISSPLFGVQTGVATYVLWKGIYWSKSVSFRNKCQMLFDWAKSWFLGRDTSRF